MGVFGWGKLPKTRELTTDTKWLEIARRLGYASPCHMLKILARTRWSVSQLAIALGVDVRTISKRMDFCGAVPAVKHRKFGKIVLFSDLHVDSIRLLAQNHN